MGAIVSSDPIFSTEDTIVAIATPPGQGGLGVVRVSGPRAQAIAGGILRRPSLLPRVATLARVHVAGVALDDVIATSFPAPRSYTGQDVVEISAHGSPVVLHAIVAAAIAGGARLARGGEFTLRAFLNGRRDLVQAEAVADLIAAATPLQARAAFDQLQGTLTRRIAAIDAVLFDLITRLEASLDFPDEGYHFIEAAEIVQQLGAIASDLQALIGEGRRGRVIREGATVVIAGRPNVGKSSLFNRLAGAERAIVTPVAGTTRDLITERVDLNGVPVTLVDTAGDRDSVDVVEQEGVSRAAAARTIADLVLVVIDQSIPLTEDDRRLLTQTAGDCRLIVANKADLPRVESQYTPRLVESQKVSGQMLVSAISGQGVNDLRDAIVLKITGAEAVDTPAITNMRHIDLISQALGHVQHAREAAGQSTPEEFLLADLQAARIRFDEIVGARSSEDVLARIFERFCIGK
jgi:tRNA modification GTPase